MTQINSISDHLDIITLKTYVDEVPAFDALDEVALCLLQTRYRSFVRATQETWDLRMADAYESACQLFQRPPYQC